MNEIDDIALRRLGDDGQRFTTGRRVLLRLLAESGVPLTIPAILQKRPGLPQSSLYRNLAVLEAAGLVTKIAMGDDHAHYELAEELTNHHHHHLVCTECGLVSDVTLSVSVEAALDAALAQAAHGVAFELHAHRLDLVGRCSACVAGGATR